ncbi:hypothetical protein GALMADRAFT_86622 [Galerina marginata CBS 339.88]|uniref:Uncharacterized protein n=1 Tax=Galerina marginata (strain CBS 339.88) TaxID=685588 RepID=A0A067TL95_GALM3|nr:hypothetical protein GALMADRAFT_86622 [Galerina marginata CBS 339.88]
MSSDDHVFLFTSVDTKRPLTARKVHLRRLYDILQLSIHRHDFQRAKRVWGILARCKEIDWKASWTTGLHILGEDDTDDRNTQTSVEYLRSMMLQYPEDRESILKELVFRLLLQEKCRDALDELELYLPSFPYQDNPVLHIYAALASLYLAQSTSGLASFLKDYCLPTILFLASSDILDGILLRDAQTHLEHAKMLDPDNMVAQAFLDEITSLQNKARNIQDDSDGSVENFCCSVNSQGAIIVSIFFNL